MLLVVDAPFWQSSYLIESAAQVERIAASRATEAWIDTGRGLDVASPTEASPTAPAAARAADDPAFRLRTAPPRTPRWTMDDELGRAAVLLDQSKRALFDMFNEARMGCAVDVRDAMPAWPG